MINRQIIVLGICLLTLWGCGGDSGTGPPPAPELRITGVTPATLSLGSNMSSIRIQGVGFSASLSIDLGSGIEIDSYEVVSGQEVDVIVNVSRNAQPGPRTIVIRSGSATATLESTLSVIDNKAPRADFLLTPTEGTVNSTFELDAALSSDEDGTIRKYKWQISDGTNPSGRRVKKKFDAKGEYTVLLTVTDDKDGTSSVMKRLTVGDNNPPVASFVATPASGTQLTTFTFDASASIDMDGPLTGYRWNFDGTEKNGKIVMHKFPRAGEYNVVLQVRDSEGSIASAYRNLSVRFFDKEEATREIKSVMVDFMNRFDDIERLSAEEIVVGFSRNPACSGRAREIEIIRQEQPFIRTASVQFVGEPVVSSVNDHEGRGKISNRFYGVDINGESYDSGVLTHNFTFVNESEGWKICNFFVTEGSALRSLNSVFGHK